MRGDGINRDHGLKEQLALAGFVDEMKGAEANQAERERAELLLTSSRAVR